MSQGPSIPSNSHNFDDISPLKFAFNSLMQQSHLKGKILFTKLLSNEFRHTVRGERLGFTGTSLAVE